MSLPLLTPNDFRRDLGLPPHKCFYRFKKRNWWGTVLMFKCVCGKRAHMYPQQLLRKE